MQRSGGLSRFPLLDGVGTARRLVDAAGTATDAYSLDAFGRYMGGWANPTQNPYRFGAAWGYITDTPGSGLLQLGARFYWPEVGRFVQREPRHGPPFHATLARLAMGASMRTPAPEPGSPVHVSGPVVGPARGVGHAYVYAEGQPLAYMDPSGFEYSDYSGSFGLGFLGPIGGVQMGFDPCAAQRPWRWWAASTWRYVHPYVGGGLMTPGPGGSAMHGCGDPATGFHWALAAGFGIGASYGGGPFGPNYAPWYEEGPSSPGASPTAYYLW